MFQMNSLKEDNISAGKYSEQNSVWPCPHTTPHCTFNSANNAIDGSINTCMKTDIIGPSSEDQTVWWRLDLGDIKSIYSIRIQFKDYGLQYLQRQRGRFAGFSLIISNTIRKQSGYSCYKDGPELPLLDITNVCTNHGRYITFYNERIDGEKYPDNYEKSIVTELCEVNVMGCINDGFYGENCDFPCPLQCQDRRCHIINGTCLGCTTGWMGDFCNKTCAYGYYGMECKSKCIGHCLAGTSCNHISGLCEYGCDAGWATPTCDQPCQDGWYGPNCTSKCSRNCKSNLPCDRASGKCESCADGYIGTFCNKSCANGKYGQNCSKSCNAKCRGQNCFHENGFCTEGCEDGYQGNTCTEKCNNGWYGKNCTGECNFNCVGKSCHHVNGHCITGCKPGWTGLNCSQPCSLGLYGENCSETCSSFCRISLHCNNTNGNCDDGCMDGYIEPKCNKICKSGWFGKNCSQYCNVNCVNQTCDHRDGFCTSGCKSGWKSSNCSEVCDVGSYGKHCLNSCSNCLKNLCDPFNGICTEGCDNGYLGKKCDKLCDIGWYGKNCSDTCNQNCVNKSCNNTHGGCIKGCEPGWMGFNCSDDCMYGTYGADCKERCGNCADNATCDRFNGSCMNGCEQIFTGDKCDKNTLTLRKTAFEAEAADSGVLGGSLATCFLFIGAVVITAIFIIRRKRNTRGNNTSNRQQSSNDHDEIEINGFDNVVFNTQSVPEKVSPKHKTITILELEERIKSMSNNENASFKKEYEKIPRGELYPCTEGKKPENVSKNRYTTTFPYDHSRVILKKLNPKESDYINANYIENAQGRRAYIATQGPKPKTIADFWRMVWQENISIIVCLTNLKEGMKTKCALYWPNVNDKIQNGQLYVRQQDEKVYANHTIRKLRIRNTVENTERDVIMFHYTQWPDHGVPDPLSLVVFHRHVMKMSAIYYAEYSLVHCSAGVGRTGTYIALDALYRQADETGKINIPKYLETMRKDRMNMIQGEDQYKTVYLALYESFRGRARSISTDRFLEQFQEQSCYTNLGHVANKSPLSAEFEELFSLRKEYSETDYEFGRKNMEANLSPNILPGN
ncbi:platelet endothelial aggregation receptor 1-like [Saccostrea cucullata]|uniref:platelet endothelial aggregation receptor 1-like n=1 Tax=Saccostrea cuccullata TaxID=36930 RepID=UPI002ED2AF67